MSNTSAFLDRIILGDAFELLKEIEDESVDLLLSDIPYGINIDDWDVLHNNTNSALLGQSPAQIGKPAFKKRGKPINGWSQADRNAGLEYQKWCEGWAKIAFSKLKPGASVFLFGARRTIHRAILALENSGFILRDVLAWKKKAAFHRAQRLSVVLERRGMKKEAKEWSGWRLGNLAPIWEPIAWLMKPYKLGGTITDNVLSYQVGAICIEGVKTNGKLPTNFLEFWFEKNEKRYHDAQKPLKLMEFLIRLTTREGQIVLDPFIGSGTTAIAARNLKRHFIGFEINEEYYKIAIKRLQEEQVVKSQMQLSTS